MAGQEIKKYEYIDLLRAFAILGVLLVHASQVAGRLHPVVLYWANYGQMGVQLFFVASSLTLCLSASERKEGSVRNFFIRRLFRIAPLYYFGIIFYFIWRVCLAKIGANVPTAPYDYSWWAVVLNVLFLHGFSQDHFNHVVPGGWSISVEMTFYLLFPLLFASLSRLGAGWFALLTVMLTMASLCAQVFIFNRVGLTNNEFCFLYASFLNQLPVFLIGLLTFKLIDRKIGVGGIGLAVGFVLAAWYLLNNRAHDTGFDGLLYASLSAVAFGIVTIRLSTAKIPRTIWLMVLQKVGQKSFSMYLMHFAVLDVLVMVFSRAGLAGIASPEMRLLILFSALVALSYTISLATGRLIEQPGMRLGRRLIDWL